MSESNRIKPLIKIMGREEIETLCERKGWTIISKEVAERHLDEIPYKTFWVTGRDENDENRPYIATKSDDGLIIESCNPSFMMKSVILKEERTISVEIKDSLANMKRAMELVTTEKEAQKVNDIICALSVLKHGREILDAKAKG